MASTACTAVSESESVSAGHVSHIGGGNNNNKNAFFSANGDGGEGGGAGAGADGGAVIIRRAKLTSYDPALLRQLKVRYGESLNGAQWTCTNSSLCTSARGVACLL